MTSSTNTRHELVQNALNRVVAEGGAPGVAAEIRDGDGTWFGSAGVSDRETGRRREPGDQFHAGSVGKAFTAAAVLTLEAEGRLGLDDTVDSWLPGVVRGNGNDGTRITIRQLLTHTSGLGITGLSPEIVRKYHTRQGFAEHRYDVWTVEKLLKSQMDIPPRYEPGEAFAYANGGYHLAGAVIEKVTGRRYEDEIDRTVIQPLGLTNTYPRTFDERRFRGPHTRAYSRMLLRDGVDPDSLTPDNYASFLVGPEVDPVDITDRTYFGWAAGGVVSTTGDLLGVIHALITGVLLPPAQHRTMWTTVPTRDWIPHARYGTGVAQWELADGRVLHVVSGVEGGTACMAAGAPDGALTVAIHLNADWNWYLSCDQIIEAAFGAPFRMAA
ncbi:serine hydrolase domain-containing protein [Streptoalloteichus hindustanus]|uniref:CubicO group peptidase, beta-lactamase class C family n=1 Tax=Streptoalloteichus hindustanus TaxID=2017 RepID=A0A1M5IFX3_STRHI|nr:serine hydrolase domain-containing protein [Streptoalloteichus hindustanus]SHG27125.1 CubicO group peptidase, beta-lactamase class C family [Streptoalloteichus hindustanus]